MEIWAWRVNWNGPRLITDSESAVVKYIEKGEDPDIMFFWAELTPLG